MTMNSSEWDEDLPPDPEEEYQTFVRTLERTDGFRLLFVQCSPAEGERLIARVKGNIPQKKIEVLRFHQSIDSLYEIVNSLPKRDEINIIFLTGIEKSLVEYIKPGYGGEGNFYKLDTVPPILNHLNLQRERFRDNFNICFVFLLRLFGLKYFIRRAPDFYDWRSGVFEFRQEKVIVTTEIQKKLYQNLKIQAKGCSEAMSAVAAQAVALYLAHLEVEDE